MVPGRIGRKWPVFQALAVANRQHFLPRPLTDRHPSGLRTLIFQVGQALNIHNCPNPKSTSLFFNDGSTPTTHSFLLLTS